MAEQISDPFLIRFDLCDTLPLCRLESPGTIDEAGCDLEHPNIRNVLTKIMYLYIKSRMTYNPTDKVQEMIDQEQRE